MRIIPAIDIINGKCVRLSKGDYSTSKVYHESPLEVAKEIEANGIQYLHLVDLDGAKAQHIVNHHILESICKNTQLKIDFGGGLKSDDDVRIAFECGAQQITGGSIAVKNPDVFVSWIKKYGSKRIILGADSKDRKISTQGWLETTDLDVITFISQYKLQGIEYAICTDIEKDGMLQGSAEELYTEIILKTGIQLIASGGIRNLNDLYSLKKIGCEGAIIGKALYEGNITLKQLSELC